MKWTSLKFIKIRILVISIGFVAFLGLILFRSYQLHISENARVYSLAQKQYKANIPLQPRRGSIYDRHGRILAMDVEVASIAVHPHLVQNKAETSHHLSQILGIPLSKIESLLASNKKFGWVERRVAADLGEKIRAKNIKGVIVVPEYRRYYPNKELASHLLGAVGYDAKALGGMELALDDYLKSSVKNMVAERDARGKLYTPLNDQNLYHDVYLTLDINLQHVAEKHLFATSEKFKVKSGFAIILDPKTGELLAMANYPHFNPNFYWAYPQANWKNHAITDTFEPGSTFKTILAAAALKNGEVQPEATFNCEGGLYQIGRQVIHDHHAYNRLSFADIVRVSSNIGVTKIAQKIGKQKFYDTILEFGFGAKTHLLFPSEENGKITSVEKWTEIDHANIAFGQGLAVTGMQMAKAYAAIANQGKLYKPHVVDKIISSQGEMVVDNKPQMLRQVLKADEAGDLLTMLEGAVELEGTGKRARFEGYTVAGKTGTAQKVNAKTRTYDKEDFVSSFIGIVPASDPQFVIYVVLDTPTPVHAGGLVAAPAFREIAKEAISTIGLPPQIQLPLTKLAASQQTAP